jgi:hypothetical protein
MYLNALATEPIALTILLPLATLLRSLSPFHLGRHKMLTYNGRLNHICNKGIKFLYIFDDKQNHVATLSNFKVWPNRNLL